MDRKKLLKVARKFAWTAAPIILVIIAWEVISQSRIFPTALFPPPSTVAATFYEMVLRGELSTHLMASLRRLFLGAFLGVSVGVAVGALMGWSKNVESLFKPIIDILFPIPGLAWITLAILGFGIGDSPAIFIVFIAAVFPCIINTLMGIRSVDRFLVWSAQSMGVNGISLFPRVLLPAAFPHILSGLRVSVGNGWRALVGAEMVAATATGLGWTIYDSRGVLRTDIAIACMLMIGIMGIILEQVFRRLEKGTLERWGIARE